MGSVSELQAMSDEMRSFSIDMAKQNMIVAKDGQEADVAIKAMNAFVNKPKDVQAPQ